MKFDALDHRRTLSRIAVILMVWLVSPGRTVLGWQTAETLDASQFQAELDRLAEVCDRLKLDEQAAECRSWWRPVRSDLHALALPGQFPAENSDNAISKWREHFIKARQRYAEHLYRQASQLASDGQESAAYRLLWQTLLQDPDHGEARRVLGTMASAIGVRPQQRAGAKVLELNAVGMVQRWQSPHFQLLSRTSTKSSLAMASRLESFYALWTQIFYELWAPPGVLKSRLAGGSEDWPDVERMQVVWLENREEYIQLLGVAEENIGKSVGYYNPTVRMSIFYQADDWIDTLHHELTHQLFSEASNLKLAPVLDRVPGAWAIEGLALYMESLQQDGHQWTVGGLDAKRLQTARYRAVRDEYWPLWQSYCQGSLQDWKAAEDVSLSYSHATGLTHVCLDLLPNRDSSRQTFLDYVRSAYAGEQNPDAIFALLGKNEQAAQLRYRELLTLTDAQLQTLTQSPTRVKQLVLSRCKLNDWQLLAKLEQLEWLDVSFSNFSEEHVVCLSDLTALRRLSMEGTKLTGDVMATVARLPELNDLDLSQCAVDDVAVGQLMNHKKLQTLWLTGTKVTEKILPVLATLPRLESCDVNATVITQVAWDKFLESHPKLKK